LHTVTDCGIGNVKHNLNSCWDDKEHIKGGSRDYNSSGQISQSYHVSELGDLNHLSL